MDEGLKKYSVLMVCVVLALATFIAFEQVRRNDFISLDDGLYVTENPQVKAGITRESVVWAFTTRHAGYWQPLTWLSHMLDCELFGLNPHRHHLTSLLFHIINTLLLFGILKKMTGAVWRSAFVAAAFALHPLHVESVAWVAERKDVLSAFFWMLTMAAYIRYAERPSIGRYLPVALAFSFGLMAKPMLVTLPFVLLLLDYWPLGRFSLGGQETKKALLQSESINASYQRATGWHLIGEKIPLFILTAVSSLVTYIFQQSWGAMKLGELLPLNFRIANALVSYISYIAKMIYPSRLAVLYPYRGDSLPVWQPIVSVLTLAVISAVIIYTVRQRRYLAIGWFWYLGMLVPVIGLIQVGVQAMADRFTYLPSIGIFIMAAWGISEVLAKWRYRKIGLEVSAALPLVAMLICTRIQLRHWQNNFTLYEHTLAVTENNFTIHYNYGNALLEKGQLEKAIKHFNEALRIYPQYLKAHNNLGIAVQAQGKLDEAINHYHQALQISPDYSQAHYNLGNALSEQSKYGEAVAHYCQALQSKPDHIEAHNNLGKVLQSQGKLDEAIHHYRQAIRTNPDYAPAYYNLGIALQSQGKFNKAISHYRQALQIKPDDADAHNNLGVALQSQSKLDEAISHYRRALRLKPDYAKAHSNLGLALTEQGEYDKAIKHFNEALRTKSEQPAVHNSLAELYLQQGNVEQALVHWSEALKTKPDWVSVLNNLAWAKAAYDRESFHKPDEAVQLAKKACELTKYNQPELLDTLAVAYAAAGNFGEAVETAEKALDLALSSNQQQLADEIKNHLELYKRGQPYRDSAQSQKKHNP